VDANGNGAMNFEGRTGFRYIERDGKQVLQYWVGGTQAFKSWQDVSVDWDSTQEDFVDYLDRTAKEKAEAVLKEKL
jgi:hypothetical protein